MSLDFDFLTNGQMVYFLKGAQWTLTISLASVVLGVVFGSILTLLKRSLKILIILNRTLMGLPPVVCGLICYFDYIIV